MVSLVLLIHVALAILSLAYAGGVVVATYKRRRETAQNRVVKMWLGTASTLVTGVVLTVLSHSSIGSACLSLLSLLVVIMVAHAYQRVALAPSREQI